MDPTPADHLPRTTLDAAASPDVVAGDVSDDVTPNFLTRERLIATDPPIQDPSSPTNETNAVTLTSATTNGLNPPPDSVTDVP